MGDHRESKWVVIRYFSQVYANGLQVVIAPIQSQASDKGEAMKLGPGILAGVIARSAGAWSRLPRRSLRGLANVHVNSQRQDCLHLLWTDDVAREQAIGEGVTLHRRSTTCIA